MQKLSLFLLLSLLFLSSLLYSEISSSQIVELSDIINQLETINNDNGTQINALTVDLTNSNKIIIQLQKEQEISKRIQTMQESLLTEQEQSLKKQNLTTVWEKIKVYGLGVLSGGLLITVLYLTNV